jgi:hypothetical protein
MDNAKIPYLKKDAIVSVQIGSGFLEQLSTVYAYLTEGITKEQADSISNKLKEKKPLELKEGAIVTLSMLINKVYEQAKETDQLVYKDIETLLDA